MGSRPIPPLVPTVQRDYHRADAQVFAAAAVALLVVKRCLDQHPVVADHQRRLDHKGAEWRRVVGKAEADSGCGERVPPGVADHDQLGPRPTVVLAIGLLEEVAGGVLAIQAGGINGGRRVGANQATLSVAPGGAEEKQDELPVFNSRLAA